MFPIKFPTKYMLWIFHSWQVTEWYRFVTYGMTLIYRITCHVLTEMLNSACSLAVHHTNFSVSSKKLSGVKKLHMCSNEEITAELYSRGVINCHGITNKMVKQFQLLLLFLRLQLPAKNINVGYQIVRIHKCILCSLRYNKCIFFRL